MDLCQNGIIMCGRRLQMLPDLYGQYSTQLVILPTQQLLSLPLLQSFGKLLQGTEGFKFEGLFLFPV